jgi:hypothetical protein
MQTACAMSKQIPLPWPIDHPEIIAIALDIMLAPSRRAHYSAAVLMLADAATERIKQQLSNQVVSEASQTSLNPTPAA